MGVHSSVEVDTGLSCLVFMARFLRLPADRCGALAYGNEKVAAMLADGTTKLRPQDWDGRPKPASAHGVSPTPGMTSQAGLSSASSAPTAEDTTQIWIVEAVARFGGAEKMVKDLKANVFAGREVRYLATCPNGKEMKVV